MLYLFGLDTDEHLVHEDADWPPVSCEGKILALEELWSDATWNACISIVVKGRRDWGQLLSQAKVYDLEVPCLVEEQILHFEVTVNDWIGMQVLNTKNYLCDVKLYLYLGESMIVSVLLENLRKLATS